MKKCYFYSLGRIEGKPVAIMRKGYTDGKWYYYRYWRGWHVIHPATGLSILEAPNRKAAETLAADFVLPCPRATAVHLERWARQFTEAVSRAALISLPAPV